MALPGILRKMLLGLLWLVPALGLAAFTMHRTGPVPEDRQAAVPTLTKVPVEVRTAEKGSRIVYVEIDPAASVPEPSTALLAALSASLLFVRRR